MPYDDELSTCDGTADADDTGSAAAADDGLLLARFMVGDQAAFAELVERHGRMVLRVCRRVLGGSADSDDAAQLAFITLARRAWRLSERRSLAGWLYGTAWHVAMRARRARESRTLAERRAGMTVATTAARRHRDERSQTDARADCIEVDRALALLPDEYREVLILHHVEGLTVQEAAQRTGRAPGTVASRLSRGRAMLRAKLRDRGIMLGLGMVVAILEEQMVRTAVAAAATAATAAAVALWGPAPGSSSAGLSRAVRRGSVVRPGISHGGWAAGAGEYAASGTTAGHPAIAQNALAGHCGGTVARLVLRSKLRVGMTACLMFGSVATAAGTGALAWKGVNDPPLIQTASAEPRTLASGSATPVPEPTTATAFAATAGWLLLRRRRRSEREKPAI